MEQQHWLNTIPTIKQAALCIIPPSTLLDEIQSIRKTHDKAFHIWMPHINLFWPFLPSGYFSAVYDLFDNSTELKTLKPFKLRLRHFDYKPGSKYLYIVPEVVVDCETEVVNKKKRKGKRRNVVEVKVEDEMVKLYGILETMLPGCVSRDFDPHLSVGQFNSDEIEGYKQKFNALGLDIVFEVNALEMISRDDANSGFRVVQRFPLGEEC